MRMLIAAAERGWVDRARGGDETLTAISRAGADVIITYFAREWAERFKTADNNRQKCLTTRDMAEFFNV